MNIRRRVEQLEQSSVLKTDAHHVIQWDDRLSWDEQRATYERQTGRPIGRGDETMVIVRVAVDPQTGPVGDAYREEQLDRFRSWQAHNMTVELAE
jgi:hypothetical protein